MSLHAILAVTILISIHNVNYIIRRGSDITQLQLETQDFLRTISFSNDTPVIGKIAAGINDVLNTISAGQTFTAESILIKLESLEMYSICNSLGLGGFCDHSDCRSVFAASFSSFTIH